MNRRDLLKLTAIAAAAPGTGAGQTAARLFDAHQLETVATLAERIIPRTDTPGAREAQVHVYLDRILADGPPGTRVSFLEGLSWLDGYCLRTYEQPFQKLSEEQQIQVLTRLSGKPDPALRPGQAFFASMKQWTSSIYYATEAGHRELAKRGPAPTTYACRHTTHAAL